MTTKKKSDALKYLEQLSGRALNFGGTVESIRLSEECSQAEFAKKLGISPSHLCDIEKGRKTVSAARASAFAAILKMSEAQFVRLALQDEIERAGLRLKVKIAEN